MHAATIGFAPAAKCTVTEVRVGNAVSPLHAVERDTVA